MLKSNITNLARAMFAKYVMIFLYVVGFGFAINQRYVLFFILGIVSLAAMIVMIIYDWKFIVGEMK